MSILAGVKRTSEPSLALGSSPATPGADIAPLIAKEVDPVENQDQGDEWVPEPSHAGGKGPRIPLRGTASDEADDGDENRSPKAGGGGGNDRPARRKGPGRQLTGDHHPPTP